jgi:hypothetical protein
MIGGLEPDRRIEMWSNGKMQTQTQQVHQRTERYTRVLYTYYWDTAFKFQLENYFWTKTEQPVERKIVLSTIVRFQCISKIRRTNFAGTRVQDLCCRWEWKSKSLQVEVDVGIEEIFPHWTSSFTFGTWVH